MQRQLGKTVIMVSHDIDEAIKLGDKVAVFRAGKLTQFAHPDTLLAHPKDEFVANFVGHDRTLKRLLLVTAGDAAVQVPAVFGEATAQSALQVMEDVDTKYLTVTDQDNKVRGYVSRKKLKENPSQLCEGVMTPYKATAKQNENLRILLSRMYEFNSSWLPVLDDDGGYLGEVTQDSIAEYLSSGKSRGAS